MTKTRGIVRIWHTNQGWGVFDSDETPGGCWAEAGAMMPTAQQQDLRGGNSVRFNWSNISDHPIEGYEYRAHDFEVEVDTHDLDDEDRKLLDLEEPVIDGESPNTVEDFFRDSRMGAIPGTPLQDVGGQVFSVEPVAADERRDALSTPSRGDGGVRSVPQLPPTGDLAPVSGIVEARQLVDYAPDLVLLIINLSEPEQRRLARWSAIQAYKRAGLSELNWVAPALAALERGDLHLPPPFQDIATASARWQAEGFPSSNRYLYKVESVAEAEGPFDNDQGNLSYSALPAVFHANHPNPLVAAIGALRDASHTFGPAVDELHDEVRREFGA